MPKQPIVDDKGLCIGVGHCAEACPKVFELVNDKPNPVRLRVIASQ
jgi:ferredoxin